MANIKSAIKRAKTNEERRMRNLSMKTEMRTYIKKVEKLIEEKNAEQAQDVLKEAVSKIDKCVQKGIIHKNNGDRKKSRLMKKVANIGA
ncbi:small subunit ribosomal protein S20 [Melghiribacillus thermohalophilus]|uniref:Small ribosomal subunit protein bS20 n=1 Tax=Melghiribacillus thermohalophilus TaxID=1324956 RepID=A0A4V2V2Y9_9BACI|nr:30S ribosomal protein S20 [Melghiribacillus thermohalophilus]TCT27041.1 small subunit ribosomal protein S20 [Melghiribacillus thermohalophilus]